MATDGEKSFVFFTYTDIQWGEATIGFDSGDRMRGITLPGSLTADVEDGSNVGVAGVYAFRVDLPEIVGPGGENNACFINSFTDQVFQNEYANNDESKLPTCMF